VAGISSQPTGKHQCKNRKKDKAKNIAGIHDEPPSGTAYTTKTTA
jgi:hypothetical protein